MDSEEDNFYGGETMDDDNDYYTTDDTGDEINEDDVEEEDPDDDDDISFRRQEQSYTVLKLADIKQRQEDDIIKVSTVLSISRVDASILLCHYSWSVSKVHDAWFADEDSVRKTVGLLEKSVVEFSNPKELITCGICFESFSRDSVVSAACCHPFCRECWQGYLSATINDGPGCLMLRCPHPSCPAAIGQDMINMFASNEDKEKFCRYLIRSYVEDSRNIKWCPAPGCEFAVDFAGGSGSGNFDVSCLCSYNFCWSCAEEAHRPVDCSNVAKWILKNSSESENTNWILVNSKPCPKCERPIEKNQGCFHMTCSAPCRFQFCWLCLRPWSKNGSHTCNRYQQQEDYAEAERREMVKMSLQKYTHYYERWALNHLSREKALANLRQMESVYLEKLSNIQRTPESQLKFILEAWVQIIECRRVLKWTYAYGYYLPEHEQAKRQLFEYLQGEAESGLERLHQCAEKELQRFVSDESPSKEFDDFRKKLLELTSVTKNYFENLVGALENGLVDVESHSSCSKTTKKSRPEGITYI